MNTSKQFGKTKNGETCTLFHMENESGSYIEFLDYGCRIVSICVPDKTSQLQDVCLGYKTLAEYEDDPFYFGAIVGRHANRIGNASFSLNGKTYQLEANNGPNHLHGGYKAFHNQVWDVKIDDDKAIFFRTFPDGESGYPGNLDVWVTYQWTKDNSLHISYEAICDADTVLNLTNHTYFNLEECTKHTILDQKLQLFSSEITEIDENCLTTGKVISVEKTPFDFRSPIKIGSVIHSNHPQIKYGDGYDHNFIIDGSSYRKAAILESNNNGLRMTCYTDQPGIQIYTSNFENHLKEKRGLCKDKIISICLETQHYPNATNVKEFPSVILKANTKFTSKTTYEFDVIK